MKKIKYLLLIVIMLFAFNTYAKEETCESSELSRLKELAKKVEFDYEYKLEKGQVEFSINAHNLNSELQVMIIEDYYSGKYKEFKDNAFHSYRLDGFKSGERVTITIKAFVPNMCSGKTVLTKTIKLPYYNIFYSEEKCKGYEEFKYCKQLIDNNISEGDFDKQFNQYIEKKEKEANKGSENNTTAPDTSNILMIMGSVVAGIIVVGIVVMLVVNRRNKYKL